MAINGQLCIKYPSITVGTIRLPKFIHGWSDYLGVIDLTNYSCPVLLSVTDNEIIIFYYDNSFMNCR